VTTGGWGVSCGSAGQHSQTAAGRAQQSSVRALPHACRQSSGAVRVLDVRIDWHVKRPTSNKVNLEPGRRGASRVKTADRVHAAAVVRERSNSGQRGCLTYACGPHGVPQEYARCGGTGCSKGAHQ